MINVFALDRAGSGINPIVRVRLIGELGRLKSTVESLGSGPVAAMNRLKLVKRANEIRMQLNAAANEPEAPENERSSEAYSHQDIRARGARQKANNAAVDIVRRVQRGELSAADLTEEDRKTLASYSGTGGSLVGEDGKKGSAYEYYTPTPVAAGIWDAMKEMGFAGGKVLDPSAGTGVFGATAPGNTAVDAVELSEVSGSINALLNNSDTYTTTISPFEAVAAATPDEVYDAVVTNVPFGTTADRGGNQLKDPKYQKDTLEAYFILRSLDKLKPGGLAAFIVPPRCTSARGGSDQKLREQASLKAEFLGAYRLPNKVFGAAAADTITDVIFYRKFSADAAQKISELIEQDPAKLSEANVLWGDYIGGKYFNTDEGRPHVLGEFKAKDPEKYRDVDRVENPASVPEIAKMLRKLPDSRINWELINTTETMPLNYQAGDTIHHGGQTLQMNDTGEWVALDSSSGDVAMAEMLGNCKDAYSAFQSGVTYDQAQQLITHMHNTSQSLDIPGWLAGANTSIAGLDQDKRAYAWQPIVVGMSVRQLLDEVGRDSGVNFFEEYAALSGAMKANYSAAKSVKPQGVAKQALRELLNHFRGNKKGYSPVWQGDVQADVDVVTSDIMGIDGLKYRNQSQWLNIDDLKSVLGADFDPMASDDWCVSADGKTVASADDYYVGNYKELLDQLDAQITVAAEGPVKDKLIRQRLAAADRVDMLSADKMQFNLFSPYISMEEKAEFLRRSVDPRAVVAINENTGDTEIMFDIRGSNLTDRDKLLRRLAYHLKSSSVSLGGTKLGVSDKEGIAELRRMIKTANEQFNGYVKANARIMSDLQGKLADPAKLRFRQTDDEAPLQVPGMHPDFQPHGYQSSWVRKMGRDFAGINGFGVGLGKTFSALLAVQYVQSMGIKKKTIFVVPNAVLSNWHKESVLGDPEKGAAPAYASDAGCLFVGLREKSSGKFDVNTSKYDEDLNTILENRHSKIFMTAEAFERIPLKDDSVQGFENYMRTVDASFAESESKKEDERKKGKAKTILSILGGKNSAAPYLEDMGVDSIVMDEGHIYKNSASTVDFSGAKYLSVSDPSARGLDAQAKCWYVRKLTPRGDGVIPLTATPLTNSPLECYSMLSLAYGHERINDMMGGISGADAFMNAVCTIEDEEEETIDGKTVAMRVFKGLSNAPMLRSMLHQVATIKNADDVGNQISVPDAEMTATPVKLTPEVESRLQLYKDAYRFAADTVAGKNEIGGSEAAFNEVSNYFGEPEELIGHPFNLINKMTMLVADPDLDKQITRYITGSPEDAEKLAAEWNKGKLNEERKLPGPNANEADIMSRKAIKSDGEVVGYLYKIKVRAWAEGSEVHVDSTEWRTQDKLEAMAKKLGIDLDVAIPAKLAAMLDNFQKENANPRGIDADGNRVKRAKQLIFCDLLSMHNKVRRLLSSKAGVPANRIAIVTGQRNGSPEAIQDVQDGFNGTGDRGTYDVVIGNKKIEVGINLQRGTQAHHHLTIGWTPDSLTQRDGRGVR
ncbi:MAG: hypothetical protein CMI13_00785, partial [Oleibacter sp.]|nr:hypothetical protein [Thalassolituus sp.]